MERISSSKRNTWYKNAPCYSEEENMLSIFWSFEKLRIPRLELKIASMKEDSLWRVIAHHICLTAFYSTSAPGDLLAGGTIYYTDSISLPFLLSCCFVEKSGTAISKVENICCIIIFYQIVYYDKN